MTLRFSSWKKLLNIAFIGILLAMIFLPGIRVPIRGIVQRTLLLTGLFDADTESQQPGQVFDYELILQDEWGGTLHLSELRGKPLFINIWATWCPPCLAEMPSIAALYPEVEPEVTFLMISVDRDREKARRWMKEKEYPFAVYFIEGLRSEALSYEAIPTTWVVDPDGTIRYQHSGMAQYDTQTFRDFLLSL